MPANENPTKRGFLFDELIPTAASPAADDPEASAGVPLVPGIVPVPSASTASLADDVLDAVKSLDELEAMALQCHRCGLRRGCTHVVFGEGDPRAAVMFVGEGPGETEDQLGRPFVGRAGQLLDKIIVASGFSREEVYIANAVKCRPPGNRQPLPAETATCLPWLESQIRLIAPKFIVLLGASAAQTLLDPKLRITAARGRWHDRNGVRCMPTFHPAALLRDPEKKRPVWEDMKKLRAEYEKTRGR